MTKETYQLIEQMFNRGLGALQDSARRLSEYAKLDGNSAIDGPHALKFARTLYDCDIQTYKNVVSSVLSIIKCDVLRENPGVLQDLVNEAREFEDELDQN